eukprot:603196_1
MLRLTRDQSKTRGFGIDTRFVKIILALVCVAAFGIFAYYVYVHRDRANQYQKPTVNGKTGDANIGDDGFQFALHLKTPNDQTFTNASRLARRYLACQYQYNQFSKDEKRLCRADDYDSAMKSLVKERRKINTKHWIWYIIPTPPLLGKNGKIIGSDENKYFALKGDDEVKDFVANDFLKGNYIQAIKLIRNLVKFRLTQNVSKSRYAAVVYVTGGRDNIKLLSSLKLFKPVLISDDRDYNDAASYLLQCFPLYLFGL